MSVSTDQRAWNDLNQDGIAQGDANCDIAQTWGTPGCEIGAPQNTLFGKTAAHAPAAGIKRPYSYETSINIQRQIVPGMSVAGGYTRRQYKRIYFTENLAVQPLGSALTAGYTPVQIPNPLNSSEMLTVYNLNPNLLGQVNLLDQVSPNNKRWFNAWDLSFQSRVLGGTVFGGASWGQQISVNCELQDPNYTSAYSNSNTPAATGLRFCDQSQFGMPYRAQYKISGTYPLPLNIAVSGSFQSNPGGGSVVSGGEQSQNEIYNVSQKLFKTLTGQTLTQTQVQVRLLQPGTVYLPRVNSTDIRFSKMFQVGRVRLQGQLNIFNIMNANPVTAYTQTYGTSYQKVTSILSPRVVAVGGMLNF